jgi:hypothetical protein
MPKSPVDAQSLADRARKAIDYVRDNEHRLAHWGLTGVHAAVTGLLVAEAAYIEAGLISMAAIFYAVLARHHGGR